MKLKHLLKGIVISLLAGSMFLGSTMSFNVSAMTSYYVFFTGYQQKKSNWCWVACAETSAKKMTDSQQDQYSTVRYLKGTNTNPYPNVGGTIADIAKAANYISSNKFSYVGEKSKKTHTFLIGKLEKKQLPIAGLSGTTDHAVVICAVFIMSDSTVKIGYYNPYDHETYSCTYNEFCDGSFNGKKYIETCYIQ